MRKLLSITLVALALSACQQGDPNGGRVFLSVVGTPFLIAFKIPVCAATIAVAAPVAGVSAISGPDTPSGIDLRNNLGDGLGSNCGPPYVVSP
jgi:hypothetical protein